MKVILMRLGIFNPRYSLRARIAVIIASLTLTLSVVLTIIIGQISGEQLERNLGQNLAQLSSVMIGQLDRTMFERWREIRNIASEPSFFSSQDNAGSVRAQLNQLRETYNYYTWIGWVDPAGKVVAGTDGLLEGQNVADRPWFQSAQNQQTPFVGNLRDSILLPSGANNDSPFFVTIATPIRSDDGTLLGVLGAYLDWRLVQEQSIGLERQLARQSGASNANRENTDVMVVGADGTLLIGPSLRNPLAPDTKLPAQSLQAANDGGTGYQMETWSDTHSQYLTGYAKDGGYRGYPGLGWIVLIRQRADVALASVTQLQLLILAIGVVFAVLFSVIGWVLAIQITRPLAHVVQLTREIKIDDVAPDRVLRADEVSVLSDTIDRLLVSLNNRNTQLTEMNTNLEHLIEERTAELAQSHQFNEKIVGTVPDLIYIFDLASERYVFINQAMNALLDLNVEDDTRLATASMHPDDIKRFEGNRQRVLESLDGTLVEQTFRFKHKDGHWVWFSSRETVFARDSAGRATQVFGVAQDITLRKQAEDKLQEDAAAQERQRLARELHDSVSQTLFSATMIAQTLPLLWERGETVVKDNLDELARLTRGALAEMRTLLNELRPTSIETANLSELLSHLTDAAQGRTAADYQLEIDGEVSCPKAVQVAVYRVAQEALNNITKHARAKHVVIYLTRTEGYVEMRIKDDGRGFVENELLSDHFGLSIMQERAHDVGAQVAIHSQPGSGTEVIFTWRAPEPVQEIMA
jgi:PAS domain S-box-containing protein